MGAGRGQLCLILVFAVVLGGCQKQHTRPAAAPSMSKTGEAAHDQLDIPAGDGTGHGPAVAAQPAATPATASIPSPGANEKTPPAPRFGRKSDVYDSQGEAYALLQSPKAAMRRFPADALGNIDWVSALSQGLINPRASLNGKGPMRRRFDDIVMRETRDMPWVNFPHAQHTEWLDCSNCHPEPFSERRGVNQISMESIMRGQHCGTCHDRVAFSIFACERCHSIPHPGSPPRWW